MAASWVDAVFSPIKTTVETLKKAVETRDAVKFGEITAGLYAQIRAAQDAALAVQEREAALRDENDALKRRLVESESLNARKARYELTTLPPGIVICTLKQGMEGFGDPQHACYICYENGKIRALNSSEVRNGLRTWTCTECRTQVNSGHFQRPEIVNTRRRYDPYSHQRG